MPKLTGIFSATPLGYIMSWSRMFWDLCILIYMMLQSLKLRSMRLKPLATFWESWARISLVATPLLVVFLFLRDPQTIPVLLILIALHVLLVADWMVTYVALTTSRDDYVSDVLMSVMMNTFQVVFIMKVVLHLLRL